MAPRGKPFKKGNKANPYGRPKTPPDLKAARQLTRVKLEILINKYLALGKIEILKIMANPETPSIDVMICSIISKAVSHGDEKRLDFILDRLIGKVPKPVELTGTGGGPIQFDDYSELTDEDVEARLAKVRARIARLKLE